MRKIWLLLLPAGVVLGGWILSDSFRQVSKQDVGQDVAETSTAAVQTSGAQFTLPVAEGKDFALHFGLKADFDQFIFDHPESSREALNQAYLATLEEHGYSPAGRQLAQSLFARYLDYKAALKDIDEPVSRQQLEAVADRLDARDQLRFQFFSEREYHYLFSRETAFDQAALARLRIAQDPGLSKAQKSQLIEAQLAALPAAQRQSFAPSMAVNRLASINQQYTNDNTRYQAMAAEFGHDVARRMQTQTAQQNAWRQRVKAYAQWESDIRQDETLVAEEKARLIEERRAATFSDREARRLQVFLENPALLENE